MASCDKVTQIRFDPEPPTSSAFVRPRRMRFNLEAPDGSARAKTWDVVDCHDAVAVLLYVKDRDAFVMVRQFRPAVYASYLRAGGNDGGNDGGHDSLVERAHTYELVAGLLDKPSLSPAEVAREELLEEAGYDVPLSALERVGSAMGAVGILGQRTTLFYAGVDSTARVAAGGGAAAETESIEVKHVPRAEALALALGDDAGSTRAMPASLNWALGWWQHRHGHGPRAQQASSRHPMLARPTIARQWFTDSPLDRSARATKDGAGGANLADDSAEAAPRNAAFLRDAARDPTARFLLFHKGNVACEAGCSALAWRARAALDALGLAPSETGEGDALVVLLGRDRRAAAAAAGDGGPASRYFRFAVDASDVDEGTLVAMLDDGDGGGGAKLVHPRSLLGRLGTGTGAGAGGAAAREAAAVMGHAAARLNWHREVRFCRRSGRALAPAGGGARRRDPGEPDARKGVTYPRTDPVAIMLVQSVDGERCLLGRTHGASKRFGGLAMYSCLAGFVEMSESVEDAVRRETREEAGVRVGDVRLVGSQPWPLGRAGHCELMLGCLAQAEDDALDVDKFEMQDARWFTRDEARALLARAHLPPKEQLARVEAEGGDELIVPGPYAIAHHLIKAWADEDGGGAPAPGAEAAAAESAAAEKKPAARDWSALAMSAALGAGFAFVLGAVRSRI